MQNEKDAPAWPYSSMLWIGTFGPNSPGGRSYQNACLAALVVLGVGMLIAAPRVKDSPLFLWAAGLLPGLTFGFIAWRLWRYVGVLDELSRRIQVESMATTYLIGMALSMGIGGMALAFGWNVSPIYYIMLDLVRAAALVVLSRKYA
jgi:hypothetical protein